MLENQKEGGEVDRKHRGKGIRREGPNDKGRRRGREPNTTLTPKTNYLSFILSSHPWSILAVDLLKCLLKWFAILPTPHIIC